MFRVMQNCVIELSFTSDRSYRDPFNEVELDVVFSGPDGSERVVPAFWSGQGEWRVRYSSPLTGRHTYRSVCSDASNGGLHGREGVLEVVPYEGENALLRHGPLRVHGSGRYLEHLDGTPFFWLGDTWWMGLCRRLEWPEEFQLLAADRVRKGFTLVQIVAGLYPDMAAFDERGANEAGFPWEEGFARINPAYFDMADLRIAWLVRCGLVPCIFGCWGYYVAFAGPEALKKHWRYIVARWGAYPVVWCVAGEVLMPWYLERFDSEDQAERYVKNMQRQWIEVARYLRSIDPWGHPVTAHPGGRGSREILGDELADVEMLQTGHGGHQSLPNTVQQVTESVAQEPRKPVIDGEVSYEGIGGTCWQDVQRLMFWVCMLSGAAGHTYGANGIWQLNRPEAPYGPSPHGMVWGDMPWQEAYRLPGSAHVGVGRGLLERYEWWRLEPAPELVRERWSPDDYLGAYAARIPGRCILVYLPRPGMRATVRLEPGARYRAVYLDPATGRRYEIGQARADGGGMWSTPGRPPLYQDLLVALENVTP